MDPLDEAARQVMAGDAAAFARIVAATSDRLVRLSARIVGRIEDAEDTVQESYLRAYRALVAGQFDRQASVRTWLYRIVTNASIDVRRSRRPAASGEEADAAQAAVPSAQGGPAGAEARVALGELARWLDVLPDEQRVALVLSAVEGLTSVEIGQIMGCSEGAVEQRLVRARVALRRQRGE